MQKLLITIFVVGLAVASVSADGWEKRLDEEHKNDLAYESQSQAKLDMDELERIITDLTKTPVTHCTNDLLNVLLELQKNDKSMRKLAEPKWRRAAQACRDQLEGTFKSAADSYTSAFLGAFNIHNGDFQTGFNWGVVTHRHLYLYLRDASRLTHFEKHDRATGEIITGKDQGLFELKFDEYLRKPCRRILSKDELLENMAALVSADSKRETGDQLSLIVELKNMNWTRRICSRIVNMKPSEIDAVFNSVQ